jgi:hypothetical protein
LYALTQVEENPVKPSASYAHNKDFKYGCWGHFFAKSHASGERDGTGGTVTILTWKVNSYRQHIMTKEWLDCSKYLLSDLLILYFSRTLQRNWYFKRHRGQP